MKSVLLSRWMPLIAGVLFCSAMFGMALLSSGEGLRQLSVTCNWRLLDSVQAWNLHGFWELGGLLTFRNTRELITEFPTYLYKSQSFIYMLPHYFATSVWGEQAFWVVVRITTVAFAVLTSVSSMVIAGLVVEERVRPPGVASWLVPAAMFSAFAAAAPQEGVWASLWNYDDRALSSVLLSCAAAILASGIRFRRHWMSRIGSILVVASALACPRMGVMVAVVLLIGAKIGMGSGLMSWRLAAATFIASFSHYIRVLIVDSWGIFVLKGSGPLVRFGYTHEVENLGQSSLPYEGPLDAFTFMWRQSQWLIDKSLPMRANVEHFLVYLLAFLGLIILILGCKKIRSAYGDVLFLLIAPGMLWTLLINQSVAEHPDIHAIILSCSFALGWAMLLHRISIILIKCFGQSWSYFLSVLIPYTLFLWQVQYFLRAYPVLRY